MNLRVPTTRRFVAWAWLPYLALVVAATHWPQPPPTVPGDDVPWDKLLHFGAYLAGGALVATALLLGARRRRVIWLAAGLALAAFALLDEATQPLAGRDFEWLDWAADVSGIAAGMALAARVARRRTPAGKRPAFRTVGDPCDALTVAGSPRQ